MTHYIYKKIYSDDFSTLDKNIWELTGNCSVSNNEFIIIDQRPIFNKFSFHSFKRFDIEFELYNPSDDRIGFGLQQTNRRDAFYFFQDINTTRINLWNQTDYKILDYNAFSNTNVWHKARISGFPDQFCAYLDETAWFAPRTESFPIYFSIYKWNINVLKIRNFKISAAFSYDHKSGISFPLSFIFCCLFLF